jgi:CRP-like cAMP-binding protein
VEVSRAGCSVAQLGRGECFGEIALLRAELPRTATVRATRDGPVHAYALSQERFITAVTGYRSSFTIADTLVTRRLNDNPAPG